MTTYRHSRYENARRPRSVCKGCRVYQYNLYCRPENSRVRVGEVCPKCYHFIRENNNKSPIRGMDQVKIHEVRFLRKGIKRPACRKCGKTTTGAYIQMLDPETGNDHLRRICFFCWNCRKIIPPRKLDTYKIARGVRE